MGVRDNFFALGGDSIRSIQVLAKANERQLSFTLEELFRTGTVEAVGGGGGGPQRASRPCRRTAPWSCSSEEDRAKLPADVEDAYPLAELQAGMLFHSVLSPQTAVYHDVFSSRIAAALGRAAAARRRWRRPCGGTPCCGRASPCSGYSQPLAVGAPPGGGPLGGGRPAGLAGRGAGGDGARSGWRPRSSGPSTGQMAPLFRIGRRTGSPSRSFQLSLSFHHAILDGWSVATLLAELFAGGRRGAGGAARVDSAAAG